MKLFINSSTIYILLISKSCCLFKLGHFYNIFQLTHPHACCAHRRTALRASLVPIGWHNCLRGTSGRSVWRHVFHLQMQLPSSANMIVLSVKIQRRNQATWQLAKSKPAACQNLDKAALFILIWLQNV